MSLNYQVRRGISHTGEHETLLKLVIVQERAIRLVDGALLN